MLALLASLLHPAQAAPDRVAWASAEGTDVPQVVTSADGLYAAFIESDSKEVRILSMQSWMVSEYAPCTTTPRALAFWTDDTDLRLYVGCDAGLATWIGVSGADSGLSGIEIEVGEGFIGGLVAGDDLVYAVEVRDEGNPQVHTIDVDDDSVDGDTSLWPEALGYSGLVDVDATDDILVVAHGDDNVSKVQLSTGSASINQSSVGAAQCLDLAVYEGTSTSVLLACSDGGIVRYATATGDLTLVLDEGDGLGFVSALGVYDSDDDLAIVLADETGFLVYGLDDSSGNPDSTASDSFDYTSDFAGQVNEIASAGAYLVAGTDDGQLWVLTDRPWVEVSGVEGGTGDGVAVTGDTISLTFTSDIAGAYEVRLGAAADDEGTVVAEGSIEADTETVATFDVDSTYEEGSNTLRVVVTSDDDLAGHDETSLTVDNPPSRVSLPADGVGFGNRQITISFDGVDDEDLASYVVYISTTDFERADYGSAGPEFDGYDDIEAPLSVAATAGTAMRLTVSPLTNGTTYYVAVRAVDDGGQEGSMSNVQSATPRETVGAAGLAGEAGGFCGTPLPATLLMAGVAALAAASRRRAGVAVLLAAAALGSPARAATADDSDLAEARVKGGVELRYGPMYFENSNPIVDIFGSRGNEMLWLEGGPSYRGLIEARLGVGFFQEMGFLIARDDSAASDEHDMLTALPLSAGLTARLDVLDEQVIVPFAGVGGSYWLWKENWYVNPDVGGEDSVGGGKTGWHWSVGGQLLLDRFDKRRAGLLDVRHDIHDTYFTVEYRNQTVGDGSGIAFTGTSLTFGLRLNY